MKTATNLNFDDIDTTGKDPAKGLAYVPDAYDGLNFQASQDMYIFNGAKYDHGEFADQGVGIGATSGKQDLIFDGALQISAAGKFDLTSVNITSGFDSSDTVEVIGYNSHNKAIYDQYIDVTNTAATTATLNYHNVSYVRFYQSEDDGNYVALDNLKVKLSTEDGPSAVGTSAPAFASAATDQHHGMLPFADYSTHLF